MNLVIIGCGYVGRRAAALWLDQDHTVAALTRSTTTAAQFLADGIQPVIGDVMQPESLAELPDADLLLYAVGFDRGAGYSQRDVYVDGLQNVLATVGGELCGD